VYWFELVELLYKLILTSVIVFFPRNAILPVGLAVIALYNAILLVLMPFLSPKDDRLQSFAQAVLFTLLTIQQTEDSAGSPAPGTSVDIVLSTLLITLVSLLFAVFVYQVIKSLRALAWHYRRKKMRVQNAIHGTENSVAESTASSGSGTPPEDREMRASSSKSYFVDRQSAVELLPLSRETSGGSRLLPHVPSGSDLQSLSAPDSPPAPFRTFTREGSDPLSVA